MLKSSWGLEESGRACCRQHSAALASILASLLSFSVTAAFAVLLSVSSAIRYQRQPRLGLSGSLICNYLPLTAASAAAYH
jgi:hypothetical protein